MSKTIGNGKLVSANRLGFTLVELLVVIAIIGVLVGLLVPAVLVVRNTITRGAIKMEVQELANAVAKYQTKYGDYPPDGSSWPVMEAHLRKAFPNILISELNLLNPSLSAANGYIRNDYNGRVMDPAEALVFFLGGFSSDAQRPFTGPGGPFVLSKVVSGQLRYNGSRQNPLYEFPSDRLTLVADPTNPSELSSTDEAAFEISGSPDLLPVFICYSNRLETGNPYVYFDSRTYQGGAVAAPIFNFHRTNRIDRNGTAYVDVARPMLAETGLYENAKSFQLSSPGMDGRYGGSTSMATPILFGVKGTPMVWGPQLKKFVAVPTGPNVDRFELPEHIDATNRKTQPIHDNCVDVVDAKTLGENL
ncbi:MAG: prepilin-type N-terminal cleavage/methylation domain-containing protein [Pirellula sp.]